MLQRMSFRISRFPIPENIEELLHPILVVGVCAPKLDEFVLPTNHESNCLRVGIRVGPINVKELQDRRDLS